MPFIVGVEEVVAPGAVTSQTGSVPLHKTGDLILVIAQQDTGTGTLSVSGAGAFSDTPSGSQALLNAQRTWAWHRYAASDNESDITVSSTLSDEINFVIIVIRGVHASTPINAVTAVSSAGIGNTQTTQSLTSTIDGCLIVEVMTVDRTDALFLPDEPTLTYVSRMGFRAASGTVSEGMVVGAMRQASAGAITFTMRRYGPTTISAVSLAIAIAPDANFNNRLQLAARPAPLRAFHMAGYDPADTFAAPSSIAATMFGVAASSTTGGSGLTTAPAGMEGPDFWFASSSEGTGVLSLVGSVRVFPAAVNMSGKILTFALFFSLFNAAYFRGCNIYLAFADSSGNWAGFKLARIRAFLEKGVQVTLSPSAMTRDDGSGTVDWTAITKMALLHTKNTTNTVGRGPCMRDPFLLAEDDIKLVAGGQTYSRVVEDIRVALDGWRGNLMSSRQGSGQIVVRVPITLGDGTNKTVVDFSSCSVETTPDYSDVDYDSLSRVQAFASDLRIKASASDIMRFSGALFAANGSQEFTIDAASSGSATYDFAGSTFSGWKCRLLASGVTVNAASFVGTQGIELSGYLSGCAIRGARSTAAVTTSDPSRITGCAFVSGGTGHALEITTPGTYTFSGNTFSGYGAAGTTNAAVYNNSGGAVTLNITGGGSTPTVRNGAVATTVVNSGATLTLTGLVPGSDIVILDAGTATERINVDAHGATTYAFNYTATGSVDICVFKAGYVPCFVRGYALTTSDASLPIAQVADRNYSNP